MESTLSATTTAALFTVSKTLNPTSNPFISRFHRHFYKPPLSQCLLSQLFSRRLSSIHNNGNFQRSKGLGSVSCWCSLGSLCALVPPARPGSGLGCVSSSAASFASGGGGGRGFRGEFGGDGGDGGSDGGDVKANSVAGGAEDVSALSPDVIILDVGGMSCGGCAASVKRILESQPQVSSASVNLTTETAVVWPVSEAKVTANWQHQLGETLANHLTSCGFKSNLRGQGAIEGDIPS